jgi:hypothetical protein
VFEGVDDDRVSEDGMEGLVAEVEVVVAGVQEAKQIERLFLCYGGKMRIPDHLYSDFSNRRGLHDDDVLQRIVAGCRAKALVSRRHCLICAQPGCVV